MKQSGLGILPIQWHGRPAREKRRSGILPIQWHGRPAREKEKEQVNSKEEKMRQRTYTAKPSEITRTWWIVDATGKPAGRLAVQVARLLQGKHKPTYTPHMDVGDHVIIVNAEKVVFTGRKWQEVLYHHTMYPGGLRSYTRAQLMQKSPEKLLERVISGMLPKNKLRDRMLKRLRIYRGTDHPHTAQQPQPYEL